MLTSRHVEILKAIVDEYIKTAEPVASKTLIEKYESAYKLANPADPAVLYNEVVPLLNAGKLDEAKPRLEEILGRSGVADGMMLVSAMHITAAVFVNDDESGLHQDFEAWLERLAPFDPSPKAYRHNRTGEENGDAHLKRQVMGREVVVAVTQGRLDFGPWEQIFYGEFDGCRRKRVLIKIIGE